LIGRSTAWPQKAQKPQKITETFLREFTTPEMIAFIRHPLFDEIKAGGN
jgi:hypothetical protein